jgi:hypothetical protein
MNKKGQILEYFSKIIKNILIVFVIGLAVLATYFEVRGEYVGKYGSGTQIGYITNIEDGMFRDNLYFRASLYGVEEEVMHILPELTTYRESLKPDQKYKIYYNRYWLGADCVYKIEEI